MRPGYSQIVQQNKILPTMVSKDMRTVLVGKKHIYKLQLVVEDMDIFVLFG